MSTISGLRPSVIEAKRKLAEGRERIRQRHAQGSPGIQVGRAMTELLDGVVLDLYRSTLDDLNEAGPNGLESVCTVIAHGGSGRQDLAPYSDVDLMLLHAPGAEARTAKLAERMVRDVFDVGLTLGQSVRTSAEACKLARGDATICTTLIESRRLAGNQELFDGFVRRFKKETLRHRRALIDLITQARDEERVQFGETVYLLEPNVKRSRGGLRDFQFLRWIGFLLYETPEPDGWKLREVLSPKDHERLIGGWERLLRIRNELHFHAGKSNDLLDRAEQVRIAGVFGYEPQGALLPVEQFMRDYFRATGCIAGLAARFVAAAHQKPIVSRLTNAVLAHRFEGEFRVGPNEIGILPKAYPKLRGNLAEILRLCDIANLYGKPIERETIEMIRAGAGDVPDELTADAATRFLALLDHPDRLGEMLRMLHELRLLEKIIPQFSHARCLLQFNEYHKYTVDEHTLRAVEQATSLMNDDGVLGEAYRGLKRKWLLHLALLLHDLGKGLPEDHSDVGLRIAAEMIPRLGIDEADGETLKFLVHKHLMMSHLAFRRDTSDEGLIVKFAVDVGSPETLQMLFVLTACDTAAVGPGTLNAWKTDVLADLYRRTRERLTSNAADEQAQAAPAERRKQVREKLGPDGDERWYVRHIDSLPRGYLMGNAPQRIADDLRLLRPLGRRESLAQARYSPERNAVEYWVGTYEDVAPGVFHRLTGALSSQGLQILSAEINTLYDGLIVDRFWVTDPDYVGDPPPSRSEEVCAALSKALSDPKVYRPTFRKLWQSDTRRRAAELTKLPNRVQLDNNTSDRYTVVEVFAADRRGLLYVIARTLFDMELSVSFAKIGTYLDQVVDVFYVVDRKGKKIESVAKRNEIRTGLLVALEAWERQETG
jgi:[protein-PII] uridylyltransferase